MTEVGAMVVWVVSLACAALLLLPHSPHAADESESSLIEVWVVLSEPALVTLPRDAAEQRSALRTRILAQQNAVMTQLAALGAIESARVQQVRNAIAVRLPAAAIESAKKIDGVTAIHPVSHRNRIHDDD
jgi:hypothetical protein